MDKVKVFIAFLLCFLLAFSFFSCSGNQTNPYSHCEYNLSLPNNFYKIENPQFDVSFTNGKEYVAILRISYAAAIKSGIPETYTADEFGLYWLKECDRSCDMLKFEDVDYCDYVETVNDEEFFYLAAFYRSKHAYFVVLFSSSNKDAETSKDVFLRYAADAYFTD